MKIYRFCLENCLAGSGALVEAVRGEFVLVGSVHPKKVESLRSACTSIGGRFAGNKFILKGADQANRFADSASGMNVEVHTLSKHFKALHAYLDRKKELLRSALSGGEEGHPIGPVSILDPSTRRWRQARLDRIDKTGCTVLRDDAGFYLAWHGRVVKVSEADAYLAALLETYTEKNIVAIMSEIGDFIGIKAADLGNLPDEVFYSIVRLQPVLRRHSPVMVFYRNDLNVVFEALRLAKLIPVIGSSVVRLAGKLGFKEVTVISPRLASEEAGLLSSVFSGIGYRAELKEQFISVENENSEVKIYLANSDNYLSGLLDDNSRAIFIPLKMVTSGDGALYAFKMVRSYGFKLITAEQWPKVVMQLLQFIKNPTANATKLVVEAILLGRSNPELLNMLASRPPLKKIAYALIESALLGNAASGIDKLPQGELISLLRALR